MIINKPFTCEIDTQNRYTTYLHFKNGVVKKFYMRGSIAWPEGKKEGFALMAGYDLAEEKVVIFEQFRFWTVGHWLNPGGTIKEREDGSGYYLGLIQFLSDNLTLYQCCSYFRGGQHVDFWNRFGKEVYQHPQASRRLEMIEVPYVSEVGPGLLLEKLQTEKFKGETDSPLEQSVYDFNGMQTTNTDYDNPTLALMTLLAGFDYAPWVKL